MRSNYILFVLTFVSLLWALSQTAYADDLTGTVGANIRAPLVITERDPIDFGLIAIDAAGDTIRIRPNGNLVITNNSVNLGGQQFGLFRVEGTPNTSVSYSFSTGDVLTGPGADIPISNFEVNRSNPFTINGSGRRNFRVGATIFPSAGQLGGEYTGTYTLTINYE